MSCRGWWAVCHWRTSALVHGTSLKLLCTVDRRQLMLHTTRCASSSSSACSMCNIYVTEQSAGVWHYMTITLKLWQKEQGGWCFGFFIPSANVFVAKHGSVIINFNPFTISHVLFQKAESCRGDPVYLLTNSWWMGCVDIAWWAFHNNNSNNNFTCLFQKAARTLSGPYLQ